MIRGISHSVVYRLQELYNGIRADVKQLQDDFAALSGGGEANTASNVGASGTGVYDSKEGVELRFRKLAGDGKLIVTLNGQVIELAVNELGLAVPQANVTNLVSDLGSIVAAIAGIAEDPWSVVTLGSDFVTSNATNTNVTSFNFAPAANKTYLIVGYFLLRTATATIGARPGIALPSGLSDVASRISAPNSNTAEALRLQGAQSTQNAASTGLPTTSDSYLAVLDALLVTGGSPTGNFQVTLAAETAGTNVTMRSNSKLLYREI